LLKFEEYRKPLRENELRAGLNEHFHWELQKQRKLKNLSRKQVAQATGLKEEDIKLLENGIIGTDYVALSALERYYGLNVRRGGSYLPHTPVASIGTRDSASVQAVADAKAHELLGDEISLIDDEQ
jgi:transcriptional regulator with XRE-family HTH domain